MAVISFRNHFVFVHIPKCGGSSFSAAYRKHGIWNDIILDGLSESGRLFEIAHRKHTGLHTHSSARQLKSIMQADFGQFVVFGTVRDPFDRMISYYKWCSRVAKNKGIAHGTSDVLVGSSSSILATTPVIKDFLESSHIDDFVEITLSPKGALRSQSQFSFLTDTDNKTIIVNRVFSLSSESGIAEFFKDLTGIHLELQVVNRSDSPESSLKLSPASRKIIEQVHSEDFNYLPGIIEAGKSH